LNTFEGNRMEIQQDFKELLVLLNDHKVEYMIVGGYALAFHGAPRYTGDLDIYVKPDQKNAQHLLAALDDFGFASVNLKQSDFQSPEMVIQLGVPPVRVDLITSISGVSWGEAQSGKIRGNLGDIPVFFIGRREFILNKKAIGRKRDFADLEALGET